MIDGIHCNGCQKGESQVEKMGKLENEYICGECVEALSMAFNNQDPDLLPELLGQNGSESTENASDSPLSGRGNPNKLSARKTDTAASTKKTPNHKDWPPVKIKAALEEYIVDQEQAARQIAVLTYNHLKRLQHPVIDGIDVSKSNGLIIGPTGTGKTLFAEVVAKMFDLPIVCCDATELTASGYVGADVDTIIKKLLDKADGDVERAERGIIFIDEADKLTRKSENPSITRDVSGEDVQQGLLKMIEGMDCYIAAGNRKHPQAQTTPINTKNILFILGGSFEGIDAQVLSTQNNSGIGFGADVTRQEQKTFDYSQITNEDLKKYGMIPELLGRVPTRIFTQPLSRNALRRILTEPKNAILKQFIASFKADGIELTFSEKQMETLIDMAIKAKSGARGLRAAVEKTMQDIQFLAPSSGLDKIVVGETILEDIDKTYTKKDPAKAA